MADVVFQQFYDYLNETYPHFDVQHLLPDLLTQEVITPDQKFDIEQEKSPRKRAKVRSKLIKT